jgi:alkylhydroperoxidase family enzyme
VLERGSNAPVEPRLKAALALIEKFTLEPGQLSVQDIRAAREAGMTDLAIEHVFYVAALWNVFSRLADAFGFRVFDDEALAIGAPIVRRVGYRFPAPLWPRG